MSEISADFNCHDGQFLQLLVLSPQSSEARTAGSIQCCTEVSSVLCPLCGLEEVDPASHLSQGKDGEVQD